MRVETKLIDVEFSGKGGTISLSSCGYHVEKQGLNSIFALPSYGNINSVDWKEYDGEDVDFSCCSVEPLDVSFKVFGNGDEAINTLIANLRKIGEDSDITISVVVKEDNLTNKIKFTTKFKQAVKNSSYVEWYSQLYEKIFSNDFGVDFITDHGTLWRHLAYVTLTFTRHTGSGYFGLLADNLRDVEGVPNIGYLVHGFPFNNVPVELRRYKRNSSRGADLVSTFNLYDSRVFCHTLKGTIHGLTQIEESKAPFEISTEGMQGKVMQTKMATKRRAKEISIPMLIRSHSVTAIFKFLGTYKTYVHNTLTSGDMLYLHCDKAGDWAVYPKNCNVTRAFIADKPWVEMTLTFVAYKEGFDFTALTDSLPDDNPEPVLPPAPPATFDPYENIDKTKWASPTFGASINMYCMNYPMLATPQYNSKRTIQYPYNSTGYVSGANYGWSEYSKFVVRYPVGTLFFAISNTKTLANGKTQTLYNTLVCLPWSLGSSNDSSNLYNILTGFGSTATLQKWTKKKLTLVGVVQGVDVMSESISNWSSTLATGSKVGGLVGSGSVRVHSRVLEMQSQFDVATGLTLTTSSDFDLLVNNIVSEFNEDPQGSGYYTEQGYINTNKE